jgi:hypothetical protein
MIKVPTIPQNAKDSPFRFPLLGCKPADWDFRARCGLRVAITRSIFESRFAADSNAGLRLPMGFLMAICAKGNQVLGSVVAQVASRLNVMDLKILHSSARLATPAVSL